MIVRPADLDEAGAIAQVHVSSWRSAYVDQVPQDYLDGLSVATRRTAWRQLLSATDWPRTGALVLVEDGQVVGFSHLGPSRDADCDETVGEMTSIYLLAEAWGRGAGRMLMNETVARLRTAGYKEAMLWVLDSNARARAFYEAGGWRHDGSAKIKDRGTFVLAELRYRLEL